MNNNFMKHSATNSSITCKCRQSYILSETVVSDNPSASISRSTNISNFGAILAGNESNFGMGPIPVTAMSGDKTLTQTQFQPTVCDQRSFQQDLPMALDRAGIVGNGFGNSNAVNGSSRWVSESCVPMKSGPSSYTSQPTDQPPMANASRLSTSQAALYDYARVSHSEPQNQTGQAADVKVKEEDGIVIKREVETPQQSDDCEDMFFSFDPSKPFSFGNESGRGTSSGSSSLNSSATNVNPLRISQVHDNSTMANQSKQNDLTPSRSQVQGSSVWDYNNNQVNRPTYAPALDRPMPESMLGSTVGSTSAFAAQTLHLSPRMHPPISSYRYGVELPQNDSFANKKWKANSNIDLSSLNLASENIFPSPQRRNYNQQPYYTTSRQSSSSSYQVGTSASHNQFDVTGLRVPNFKQLDHDNATAATMEMLRNGPRPVTPDILRRLLDDRGESSDNRLPQWYKDVLSDPFHCSSCTCTSACMKTCYLACNMSPGYNGGCYTIINNYSRLPRSNILNASPRLNADGTAYPFGLYSFPAPQVPVDINGNQGIKKQRRPYKKRIKKD